MGLIVIFPEGCRSCSLFQKSSKMGCRNDGGMDNVDRCSYKSCKRVAPKGCAETKNFGWCACESSDVR